MGTDKFACSTASAQAGEPLLGTAPHADMHVFLSWPRKEWAADPLETKGLPPFIPEWIAAREPRGSVRFRLMWQDDHDPEHHSIDIFGGSFRNGLYLRQVPRGELEHVLTSLDDPLQTASYAASEWPRRSVYICTHGKRDRCCAKHGRALYRAAFPIGAAGNVAVWESSHLGGHRFAATAAVFPDALAFGRLRPEHAEDLIDCDVAALEEHLRGHCALQPIEQVAATALGLDAYREADWQVGFAVKGEGDSRLVAMDLARGDDSTTSMTVQVTGTTFESPPNCSTPEKTKSRTSWHLDRPDVTPKV